MLGFNLKHLPSFNLVNVGNPFVHKTKVSHVMVLKVEPLKVPKRVEQNGSQRETNKGN